MTWERIDATHWRHNLGGGAYAEICNLRVTYLLRVRDPREHGLIVIGEHRRASTLVESAPLRPAFGGLRAELRVALAELPAFEEP